MPGPLLRPGRFQEAEASSFAAVQDVHPSILRIIEYKEIMTQQFHLVNSLFFTHGHEFKLFATHNLRNLFCLVFLANYWNAFSSSKLRLQRLEAIPCVAATFALVAANQTVHFIDG